MRFSAKSLAMVFAVTLCSVSTGGRCADSTDIFAKAVTNVLGGDWLPLVPPKTSLNLGIPVSVKSGNVVVICQEGIKSGSESQKVLSDVKIDFALSGGVRLELLLGKGIAQWLLEAGLVNDLRKISKISATIGRIENREISLIQLRQAELKWSPECKSIVKDEWQAATSQPFTVLGVSYWSNTKIQAYDKLGAQVALSGKPRHIGATGKLDSSLDMEDQYSVRIPGSRVVALRAWPLRKRTVGLGSDDLFTVELDSQPFTQQGMDSLYRMLEPELAK